MRIWLRNPPAPARVPLDIAPTRAYHAGTMEANVKLDFRTARADWPSEPLVWGEPQPLTRADIQMLTTQEKGYSGDAAKNPLQRITERHHALARLLAVGTPPGQAAIITGYSNATVSILQGDPSFQELVEFYSLEVNAEYRTMQAQLAGLGEDAIAELRRRVEDTPTELGAAFLLDVVTKIADRTGNGPTSTTKNETVVTLDLSARMKAAREKAQAAIEGAARDITPKAAAE